MPVMRLFLEAPLVLQNDILVTEPSNIVAVMLNPKMSLACSKSDFADWSLI